jgi:hypothetical protein
MAYKQFGKTVRAGCLAAAAAACAAVPAQAAVYTGNWDPGYGSPFPNLGWKGKATFFIPDACLSLASTWVANVNACSGGGMKVLDATLSFYDIVTDSAAQSFSFVDPGTPLVYEMFVGATNQLEGVSTAFFAPVTASTPAASALAGSAYFHLAFLKESSPAGTPSVQLYHTDIFTNPVCLFTGSCKGGFGAEKAVLEITPAIPEPSTYALMLGGLAALAAAVRRRRR